MSGLGHDFFPMFPFVALSWTAGLCVLATAASRSRRSFLGPSAPRPPPPGFGCQQRAAHCVTCHKSVPDRPPKTQSNGDCGPARNQIYECFMSDGTFSVAAASATDPARFCDLHWMAIVCEMLVVVQDQGLRHSCPNRVLAHNEAGQNGRVVQSAICSNATVVS